MPQECDAVLQELAFADLDVQGILTQTLQHQTQMGHVLRLIAAVDDNVIKIDLHTLASQIAKHIVHDPLETTGCVGQAHREHQPLILSISGHKRGLLNAILVRTNLPVARPEIQAAKHTTTSKTTDQIIGPRDWKFVANCSLV